MSDRFKELRAQLHAVKNNPDLALAGVPVDAVLGLLDTLDLTLAHYDTARAALEASQRDVKRYREREAHFAQVLSVADGGQYRNDWDGAIKRVIEERDALRTELEALRRGG